MTVVVCQNATNRKTPTWQEQLAPWDQTEFIISDAAKAIAGAVTRVARSRRDDPNRPGLEHGLDLFHTTYEAHRLLRRQWRAADATWQRAEAAEAAVKRAKQQGLDSHRVAQTARKAWNQARKALAESERLQAAWDQARSAFELFDEQGHLNHRERAETLLKAALPALSGTDWSKVRTYLNDTRSLSFLDRMHRRLEQVEADPSRRQAWSWRWWLGSAPSPAADPRLELARQLGRGLAVNAEDQIVIEAIGEVLRSTVRSSSAVECFNSVLRMQQCRHRRMTQGMLDLKRLWWNCHRFDSGPRRKRSPYEALGLNLPTFDFWTLLQSNPQELTQTLSTAQDPE